MTGTTIRIKLTRENNIIQLMTLEEYLRGVVPSEMPAGSAGAEALKAQAVAARTYALQKIMTRSGQPFDVDDTTRYQAYYSKKIHNNSDKAIRDTDGQVLIYDGKVLDTCVYCASNGGRILSSQEVWGGERPYLFAKDDLYDRRSGKPRNGHGVGMSQHGAMQMDKAGLGYKVILAYYYPGTQIVNVDTVYKG